MAKTSVKFSLDRAKAGTAFDIAEQAFDAYSNGVPLSQFAAEELANRAIERYQIHILAGLRRAGVDLEEGEVLNAQTLLRIIRDKTGIDIVSLTPAAVVDAVQSQVSARMSDVLGVEVQGITSAESLKTALIDAAKYAVTTGRANQLINATVIRKLRSLKTWKTSGVDPEQKKKMLNRWYQKKYRRTHKEVWVGSPAAENSGTGIHGFPRDT